jgi:hypothetical protein
MNPAGQLRQATLDRANGLALLRGGFLDSGDLAGGFEFDGKRIPIVRPPSMPSRNG